MANYFFLDTDVEIALLTIVNPTNLLKQIQEHEPDRFLLLPPILLELGQKLKNELGNPQAKSIIDNLLNDPCYQYYNVDPESYLTGAAILEDFMGPVEVVHKCDKFGYDLKSNNGKKRAFLQYRGVSYFKTLALAQLQAYSRAIINDDKVKLFSFDQDFVSIARNLNLHATLLVLC
jgi:hypothetical protein